MNLQNKNFLKPAIGIFLIVLLIFLFIFFSFKESKKILIDNPTTKEIKVKIDNWKDIVIPPISSKKVEVSKWKHKVFLNWKEVWEFEKEGFWFSNMGGNYPILNPTLSNYFLVYRSYWDVPLFFKQKADQELEWLYFKSVWDYDLDKSFPLTVDLETFEDYTVKSKIYRPAEYKFRTIHIDNPWTESIKLRISDYEEFSIEPWFVQSYILDDWYYYVYLNWKKIWLITKKLPENYSTDLWHALLNPLEDNYIIAEDSYWNMPENYKYNDIEKRDLFIYPIWNYDLTEEFPEEFEIPEWKDYVLQKKIYLKREFEEIYGDSEN